MKSSSHLLLAISLLLLVCSPSKALFSQETKVLEVTDNRWKRLARVFFLNSDTGWIVDLDWSGWLADIQKAKSIIYITNDGGKTWVPQSVLPFPVEKIAFADSQNGWAVSYGSSNIVANTDNGGQQWRLHTFIPAANITQASRTAADSAITIPRHLVAIDKTSAWVVKDGNLVTTTDGGVNWQVHKELAGIVSITCTANIGFALSISGELYRSDDVGGTWKTVPARLKDSQSPLQTKRGEGPALIRWIDEKHGWILRSMHGSGAILYTADGGRTWTVQDVVGTKSSTKSFLYVGDAELKQGYGWAAGSNETGEYVVLRLSRGRWIRQFNGKPPAVGFSVSGASPYTAWVIVGPQTIWKLSVEEERLSVR